MSDEGAQINRRTFLKAGGALGVAALVGEGVVATQGALGHDAAFADSENAAPAGAGLQNAFYFDAEACIGCQTCAFTCKETFSLEKAYRSVYQYAGETDSGEEYLYHVSVGCSFCNDAACISVCPTGAMHKTDDLGHVVVDTKKCIGCGYCDMACPYNIPRVDKEKGHSVKCNGCYEVVAIGGMPACVESCPMSALQFGSAEEMSKLGDQASIAPLPDPKYTDPNFYISAGSDKRPSGSIDGEITNYEELV